MCRASRLCCFRCLGWFSKEPGQVCSSCGDWRCPDCGACICSLPPVEQKIALAYMATYENLLKELTGEGYDFSKHRRIIRKLGIRPQRLTIG